MTQTRTPKDAAAAQAEVRRLLMDKVSDIGLASARTAASGLQIGFVFGAAEGLMSAQHTRPEFFELFVNGTNSVYRFGLKMAGVAVVANFFMRDSTAFAAQIRASRREMRTVVEPFVGGALGALLFMARAPVPGGAYIRPMILIRRGSLVYVSGGQSPRIWRGMQGAAVGIAASLALRAVRVLDWGVRSQWTKEDY